MAQRSRPISNPNKYAKAKVEKFSPAIAAALSDCSSPSKAVMTPQGEWEFSPKYIRG